MTLRELILQSDKAHIQGYPQLVAGCQDFDSLFDLVMSCHHPRNDAEAGWFEEVKDSAKKMLSLLFYDIIQRYGGLYANGIAELYHKLLDFLNAEASEQIIQKYLTTLQVVTMSTRLLMDLIAADRGYAVPFTQIEMKLLAEMEAERQWQELHPLMRADLFDGR